MDECMNWCLTWMVLLCMTVKRSKEALMSMALACRSLFMKSTKGSCITPQALLQGETALDSSNAMENNRLVAQSSGSWKTSSMGLLQFINGHCTYLTVTLLATLQSSNVRCSSCGDCTMASFHIYAFSGCTVGSSHTYAFCQDTSDRQERSRNSFGHRYHCNIFLSARSLFRSHIKVQCQTWEIHQLPV